MSTLSQRSRLSSLATKKLSPLSASEIATLKGVEILRAHKIRLLIESSKSPHRERLLETFRRVIDTDFKTLVTPRP